MVKRFAHRRQCPALHSHVEDVEPVSAQEREVSRFGEPVPQRFERDRLVAFPALGEQVDHLAEGANPLPREPLGRAVDDGGDHLVEAPGRDLPALAERRECLLRIEVRQATRLGERSSIPAGRGEHLRERLVVLRRRDHDRGLADREPGREIRRD